MHWYYWVMIVVFVGYICLVAAIRYIDHDTNKEANRTKRYTDPSVYPNGRKSYERDAGL